MALDDQFDDDPYRRRVLDDFNPNSGIAGPQDFPQAAPRVAKSPWNPRATSDWVASGGNTPQQAKDFFGNYEGVTFEGDDKIRDPSGRLYDVINNVGTAGASARTGYTTDPRYKSGAKPQGNAVKGQSSRMPASAGAPAAGGSPFQQQIRDIILSQLAQLQQQPNINDPALAAQSQAYGRARQQSAERERAAQAERAAANGLLLGGQSSGAFDTTVQGINEQAGQDTAAFDAGLVGQEVQQRRATLERLLQMAVSTGDAESARALQLTLANMDAQLRREQMKQQGSQFNQQLGQQRYFYDDTMGFNTNRAGEDDYRWRVNQALGV